MSTPLSRKRQALGGKIAILTRHNPYDPRLAALRAELAELQYAEDRERVAQLHDELPAMTPDEIRRVAVAARKNDRNRSQREAYAARAS